MNLQLQATRVAMRALERTAPRLGAALAERLFFTPPRTSLTPPIRDVLATGRPFRVCVEDGRVAAWAWGHGPAVALVHGWEAAGAVSRRRSSRPSSPAASRSSRSTRPGTAPRMAG